MGRRFAQKGLTVGALLLVAGGLATAAVGASAATTGSTTASVAVNSTITLSGLTSAFTITGDPSTTVAKTGAVSGTVTTNNSTGYNVSVKAASATMAGATTGNTDTIPIANLGVKDSGGSTYAALSSSTANVVKVKSSKSASAGDAFTDDYQIQIPFVNSDTYSATLNYTAATQ
jgi:hypothetical protein